MKTISIIPRSISRSRSQPSPRAVARSRSVGLLEREDDPLLPSQRAAVEELEREDRLARARDAGDEEARARAESLRRAVRRAWRCRSCSAPSRGPRSLALDGHARREHLDARSRVMTNGCSSRL